MAAQPLGIQRYALEILKELDRIDLGYDCEVLVPSAMDVSSPFNRIKIVRYGNGAGFVWRQLSFPRYCAMSNAVSVDLTLGLPAVGCDVVCLHDCIYENCPIDFRTFRERIKRYSYLIRAAISVRLAKRVVTVSDFSKREIASYYKCDLRKISVISNSWQHFDSVDADFTIIEDLNLSSKPFCFSLGSKLPHKNFQWIIAAAHQNPDLTFVVTGTSRLVKSSGVKSDAENGNIIFTGYLSDGQVKALMSRCTIFLHPSLYEGFGIPPLEALSCGAKIAISNQTCLPEIYGESASYFDPFDYSNIRIETLTTEKDRVCTLNKYSWRESASRLNRLLSELVG